MSQNASVVHVIAQKMSSLILVPCSDRKRYEVPGALKARALKVGQPKHVAAEWVNRIKHTGERVPAKALYCGRAFREGELAAQILDAQFYILSAGMGLVASEAMIPAYSLTVSPSAEDAIQRRLRVESWRPSVWWKALNGQDGIRTDLKTLFDENSKALVLVALSENYAKMVVEELVTLNEGDRQRLRIFGLGLTAYLPASLHTCLMPYDRRLDDPNGPMPGTLSDFATRALRHFATLLKEGGVSGRESDEDAKVVANILEPLQAPRIPSRVRISDDAVKAFIHKNWELVGGRSQAMLRYLRDSGLACEQSRFKCLFHAVIRERKGRLL